MRRQQYKVSPEAFVRAWQSSETAGEVASKVRMPRARVFSRAAWYRRKGVRLKKLRRSSRKLNVAYLNAIIAAS